MPLLTRGDLDRVIARFESSSTRTAGAILTEENRKYGLNQQFDIFLSHCFIDVRRRVGLSPDELLAIKRLIENLGFSVYVDWLVDDHLDRSRVTPENAALIRHRMDHCRSLVFATSENSRTSVWMPWELGYFDGKWGKAAILPVIDNTSPTKYSGQEYLGIYPYIGYRYHPLLQVPAVYLVFPDGSRIWFETWIDDDA